MGRAQQKVSATDAFAALLGARRGLGGSDLAAAHSSMQRGVFEPALRAVDEGTNARDPQLAEQLSLRLAGETAPWVEATLTSQMKGLLRPAVEGGSIPIFEHPFFVGEAAAAIAAVLREHAGEKRGPEILRAQCEAAVTARARKVTAAYLRRGGAAHLRSYFGQQAYSTLRRNVHTLTDISLRSAALASYIRDAVSEEWVRCVCEHPDDKFVQSEHLAELAMHLRND